MISRIVPTHVNLVGSVLPVISAVFKPGGHGMLDSHIVVYSNGKGYFNVHYHIPQEDGSVVLHQGSYDLAYPVAVQEMERRYNL